MRKHNDFARFERFESAALRLGHERPSPALEREDFENVCLIHDASLAIIGLRTVSPSANFQAPIADFHVIFCHGRLVLAIYVVRPARGPNAQAATRNRCITGASGLIYALFPAPVQEAELIPCCSS